MHKLYIIHIEKKMKIYIKLSALKNEKFGCKKIFIKFLVALKFYIKKIKTRL